MATKLEIKMDCLINDIELSLRRAKVLVNDLDQDYFGCNISNPEDIWKISGEYYDTAGTRAGIANSFLYDADKQLGELRKLLNNKEAVNGKD